MKTAMTVLSVRRIRARPGVALLVCWSLMFASAHAVSPYSGHEAVEEEAVRDLAWRNAAAWNAHDADAWADTFAADAEITTGAATIEGRDAIRAHAAQLYSGPYARSTLRVREVRVRLQSRDVAAVDRVQMVTGIAGGDGGMIAERAATAFFLARKERGRWVITLMRDAPEFTRY